MHLPFHLVSIACSLGSIPHSWLVLLKISLKIEERISIPVVSIAYVLEVCLDEFVSYLQILLMPWLLSAVPTYIFLFFSPGQSCRWTATELAEAVGVPVITLRRRIMLWVNQVQIELLKRIFNSTSGLHCTYALNVVIKLQLHNLILVSDREFLSSRIRPKTEIQYIVL